MSGIVNDITGRYPTSSATNGTYNIGWRGPCLTFHGNANDASVYGTFDGTVNGPTLTTSRFEDENEAYNFSGETTNNEITVPHSSGIVSPSTMSSYIVFKPEYTGENQIILAKDTAFISVAASMFGVRINIDSKIEFEASDGSTQFLLTSTNIVKYGAYNYLTISWENNGGGGANYFLNLNGTIVSGIATSGSMQTNTDNIWIGRNNDVTNPWPFKGIIDEVSIINYVMYEYTSQPLISQLKSHKIDRPLITKTDSNNITKTGYDFWGTGFLDRAGTFVKAENFDLSGATEFSMSINVLANWDFQSGKPGPTALLSISTGSGERYPIIYRDVVYPTGQLTVVDGSGYSTDVTVQEMNIYTNKWINIIYTQVSGGDSKLYINDNLVASSTGRPFPTFASTDELWISGNYDSGGLTGDEMVTATISTPIISNRVWTDAERQKISEGEVSPILSNTYTL
jgi:hypothetical protein